MLFYFSGTWWCTRHVLQLLIIRFLLDQLVWNYGNRGKNIDFVRRWKSYIFLTLFFIGLQPRELYLLIHHELRMRNYTHLGTGNMQKSGQIPNLDLTCSLMAHFFFFFFALAFGHATRSIIVGNQTVIDKNFPVRGNAFFIIFKNSTKFEYREFVSAIYAKRKFDPSSSTFIWRKYLCAVSLIYENALIESPFLINFNAHKIQVYLYTSVLAYENRGIFLTFHRRKRRA